VIISSFSCDHCHIQNNSVESANKIQERGVKYKLLVSTEKDLNRELVKSDFATFKIPLIDFEIPAQTQKGSRANHFFIDFLNYVQSEENKFKAF
jgi:zinc finger protein